MSLAACLETLGATIQYLDGNPAAIAPGKPFLHGRFQDLAVDGTLTATNFVITGSTVLDGDLEVKGNTLLDGTMECKGNTLLDGDLEVKGNTLLDGKMECKGATKLDSTFEVVGIATLDSSFDCKGAATLESTLEVKAAATFDTTMECKGAATLDSTLGVTGQITTSNTAQVGLVHATGPFISALDLGLSVGLAGTPSGYTPSTFSTFQSNQRLSTTASGPFTATNVQIDATRVGNVVTLQFPGVNVTSGAAAIITFADPLPAILAPVIALQLPIIPINNGAITTGFIGIGTDGTMTIQRLTGAFVSGNTAGWSGFNVTYRSP